MPGGTPLICNVEEGEDHAVVSLAGELDIATVDDFRGCAAPLVARGFGRLLLDMSDVDFLDSTGLSAMLELQRQAAEAGGQVILRRPSPFVRRVLDLSGTGRVFGAEPDS